MTAAPAAPPAPAPDEELSAGERWWYVGAGFWGGFAICFVVGLAVLVATFGGDGGAEGTATGPVDGAVVFEQNCASCHGADGMGGVGPQLAGRVADVYPDIGDQIAVITAGRNAMPAFDGRLSDAQIEAVAEFTRGGF